jgi:hypothetical protein
MSRYGARFYSWNNTATARLRIAGQGRNSGQPIEKRRLERQPKDRPAATIDSNHFIPRYEFDLQ